jgi:hypothetical protein
MGRTEAQRPEAVDAELRQEAALGVRGIRRENELIFPRIAVLQGKIHP